MMSASSGLTPTSSRSPRRPLPANDKRCASTLSKEQGWLTPLALWLGDWADTIAEHHERFDGSGYPVGLVGHEISLGARIVAVADSYDAMTHLNGYRKPKSTRDAQLQLAAYAGTEFDPVVVRAFLTMPPCRRHGLLPPAAIETWFERVVGMRPARIVDDFGRVGVCAVVVAAAVIALGVGQGALASPSAAHRSAPPQGPSRSSAAGAKSPTVTRGRAAYRGAGGGSSATAPPAHRSGGSPQVKRTGPQLTRAGDTRSPLPVAQPPTRAGSSATGPTTTVPTTSQPSIPTTTVGGRPPTRSTTTTTTSTTDPPIPIAPPSGLMATSDCQVVVLLPEVSLSWTASPTASVTGYVVLRGTSLNSLTHVGTVSGRTDTSYTDTSVSGLATTYWYEVEAVSGDSSAVSDPISVTTPSLCLSASTPG